MKKFTYHNPVKIFFDSKHTVTAQPCSLDQLKKVVNGRKAILVTSKFFTTQGITEKIKENIKSIVNVFDEVDALPSLNLLEKNDQKLYSSLPSLYQKVWMNKQNFEVIIALGGGSVIDAAKIISVYDSSKKFSSIKKIICGTDTYPNYKKVPVIAIPTTAGTGSDVTPWATAWDIKNQKKYSLHLPDLWCEAAIYDPNLTLTMPKHITIQTALDALSHSFESIWNKNANPISTQHAIFAAKEILHNLPRLLRYHLPRKKNLRPTLELRSKIMQASLHAGLAFSNTKTAIAHAMSYYITMNKFVPHGIACSFTLPAIIKTVLEQENIPSVQKSIREIFYSKTTSYTKNPVETIVRFFAQIGVSIDLDFYGLTEHDIKKIEKSTESNPRAQNSLVDNKKLFQNLKNNAVSKSLRKKVVQNVSKPASA